MRKNSSKPLILALFLQGINISKQNKISNYFFYYHGFEIALFWLFLERLPSKYLTNIKLELFRWTSYKEITQTTTVLSPIKEL